MLLLPSTTSAVTSCANFAPASLVAPKRMRPSTNGVGTVFGVSYLGGLGKKVAIFWAMASFSGLPIIWATCSADGPG